MFTYLLYIVAITLLFLSFIKDKIKTKKALKKALKAFENILPQFLAILLLIGMLLSVLDESVISNLIGAESGVLGMAIAAVVGSVTLIPGFVAFPLAASLLNAGAGYGQITMFISTLMMVGLITIPVEIQYFRKSLTLKRNLFAFFFSILCALIVGGIFS